MIEIKETRWKGLLCNLCFSKDDVCEIYFRSENNSGHVITMCKKCRSELRSRLTDKDGIKEEKAAKPDKSKLIHAWKIFRDSNPYEICDGKEFRAIREPEYCMGQMINDTIELLKKVDEEND